MGVARLRGTGGNISNASTVDVVVVGAGVAGLAALCELESAGLSACAVEARDRIGGRILTVRDDRLPHAIELGAEFVHGSAQELVEILDRARLAAFAIDGKRWRKHSGRLVPNSDFWKQLDTVMRHLKPTGADESFADFLFRSPGGRGAVDARALAKLFVEGFHAADTRLISAHALASGGSPGDDPEEQRQMRIPSGYDQVPATLGARFHNRVMTQSVVERIEWERGSVAVTARANGRALTINSKAVIVTVPVGVVFTGPEEEGGIEFAPAVPLLEKMRRGLTMGSVVRLVMLFRERWWTERMRGLPEETTLDSMSFLMGDAKDFPVMWTLHPAHLPALVCWAGGPNAQRMGGLSQEERLERAIASVAKNFGATRRRVESQLVDHWTHDWDDDPYARGAYSYSLVGGSRAASQFAKPVEKTIWFAGEAADPEGRNGTVHGAIGSGQSAARSISKVLRTAVAMIIAAVCGSTVTSAQTADGEWRAYGHDVFGSRYSPLTEINRENVSKLAVAWTYHTGEPLPTSNAKRSLEVTPLMIGNTLYLNTPLGKLVALDPVSGKVKWEYDAKVSRRTNFGDFTTRGVSALNGRIYMATTDGRLIAVDATTGARIETFGDHGTVDLRNGLRNTPFEFAEYEVTSPPAIVNGLVIVGSAVADNNRTNAASGECARTTPGRERSNGCGIRCRRMRAIRRTRAGREPTRITPAPPTPGR